ncbi:hypothetical protein BDF14DRAFT_1886457 [Spinellus fusiger]|nr:hypothetical protein BDF14DRAFT_1886457 [Spinellus fusiger]
MHSTSSTSRLFNDDSLWRIVDIVMYVVTDNLVLAFLHEYITQMPPSGVVLCGEATFTSLHVNTLKETLHENNIYSTKDSHDLSSSFQRIFCIMDTETKDVLLSLPDTQTNTKTATDQTITPKSITQLCEMQPLLSSDLSVPCSQCIHKKYRLTSLDENNTIDCLTVPYGSITFMSTHLITTPMPAYRANTVPPVLYPTGPSPPLLNFQPLSFSQSQTPSTISSLSISEYQSSLDTNIIPSNTLPKLQNVFPLSLYRSTEASQLPFDPVLNLTTQGLEPNLNQPPPSQPPPPCQTSLKPTHEHSNFDTPSNPVSIDVPQDYTFTIEQSQRRRSSSDHSSNDSSVHSSDNMSTTIGDATRPSARRHCITQVDTSFTTETGPNIIPYARRQSSQSSRSHYGNISQSSQRRSYTSKKSTSSPSSNTKNVEVPRRRAFASIKNVRCSGFTSERLPSHSPPFNQSTKNCCESCNTDSSPEWRRGPSGHKTLCNACGLRYARSVARQGKLVLQQHQLHVSGRGGNPLLQQSVSAMNVSGSGNEENVDPAPPPPLSHPTSPTSAFSSCSSSASSSVSSSSASYSLNSPNDPLRYSLYSPGEIRLSFILSSSH